MHLIWPCWFCYVNWDATAQVGHRLRYGPWTVTGRNLINGQQEAVIRYNTHIRLQSSQCCKPSSLDPLYKTQNCRIRDFIAATLYLTTTIAHRVNLRVKKVRGIDIGTFLNRHYRYYEAIIATTAKTALCQRRQCPLAATVNWLWSFNAMATSC